MAHRSLIERMAIPLTKALGFDTKSKVGRDSSAVDPRVALSKELFDRYRSGSRAQWTQRFDEANRFRNGVQWTKEQVTKLENRGHSPMVVNYTHAIIETAKAMLTYHKPQFRATGREDSDRQTASAFADLFQWIWDVSTGNEELKRAIDDYYVGGMGVLQVYQDTHADMGKGEVKIRALNPLSIYIDPNSKDIYCRDAAHILVRHILTDELAFQMYPQFKKIIKRAPQEADYDYPSTDLEATEDQVFNEDVEDAYHTKREYIERYTRIRVPMYHIYEPESGNEFIFDESGFEEYAQSPAILMTQGGQERLVTDDGEIKELLGLVQSTGGVFHFMPSPPQLDENGNQVQAPPQIMPGEEHEGAIPGSTVILQQTTKGEMIAADRIVMNRVMESRIKLVASVGSEFLYERILPCEDYPIVVLMNVHNRNPFPESDVRLYRPIQEYINKLRSLLIAYTTNATNIKVLVPRGSVNKSVLEQEFNKAGTAVIEYEAELGEPVIAGPVPIPNGLFQTEAEAKHDLEYGFGIFELMQGSPEGAPSTYRGTLMIDEFGQRRSKSKRDDIEGAINQLARVAIPLMQQLYTEEKIVRLVQPGGLTKDTVINQSVVDEYTGAVIEKVNDVTTGKYDVIVVTGSTLPSNRWARLEMYKELYKEHIIDQVEVLKKTEVVDVEGVLQRMGYIKQLEQALQQAQGEIKRLSGDLQTASREEVHAKKRLEVEKFKTNLHKAETEAGAASQLFDARLKDELANIKQAVKPQSEGRSLKG